MPAEKPLVTIRTARQGEAQIIKGRLESEGIPVFLSYDSLSLVCGFTVDGLGEVKIIVPGYLAKEAEEILGINVENNIKLQGHDEPNCT